MEQEKSGWIIPLVFFTITLLTRIPFTSKLLYNLDSVHFALALEKYDVYLHQPHPPGYFLYVMAGKAINLFVQDANVSYLVISVIASGFTVVAVYYLGCAVFNQETGRWAALLAMTSPLLWFYGEVALTYIVAAFFNVWIAWLCWKLLHYEHKWLYFSAVILGIAAGIRQDLLIFLIPLWLFCIRRLGWQKILGALVVLGLTISAWFIPMLGLTGGPEQYFSAVQEQWDFFNSTFTIWNAGVSSRAVLLMGLAQSISYGMGIGTVFLLFALYALIRTDSWRRLSGGKVLFFLLWLLPAFLFDMFIFMHPSNPGLGLFFVPAFLILLYPSVEYAVFEMKRVMGSSALTVRPICSAALVIIITINAYFFLWSDNPVSANQIKQHDYGLSTLLSGIQKTFPSQETIIFNDKQYLLFSYTHIMYYLPYYRVYLTNVLQNDRGEKWHVFGGINRETRLSDAVEIPPNTRYIVHFLDPSDREYTKQLEDRNFHRIFLDNHNVLYYEEIKR